MPEGLPMDQRYIYEIAASYPQLNQWYGWLAGLAYTLPYSLMGLVAGAFTNKVNRKFTLGITMMLAGVTQFLSGSINSFPVLVGMRVAHGSLNAATSPLAYSLVSDYVPPEKRATANAVLSSSVYLGISLSSMSILLIKSSGWRVAY
jgi:MFS family permease